MAKDLTIRLLGRPQVTKDDQVGYQRIVRQYVVEGYRASYAGINDSSNPLFLAVGTADEEFTDHYLVNQKIAPKQGSVDTAYLTREFVEIRDTHVQESVVTTNDVRRVRRTFVVLRAIHSLGYNSSEFNNHPQNNGGYEPWSYAPTSVKTPPISVAYGDDPGQIALPTNKPISKNPGVGYDTNGDHDQNLYDVLNGRTDVNTGNWLKGSAQVSMSQPGVDVWSVEWVTHAAPYWSAGVKQGKSSGFKPPKTVSFDEDGLRIVDFGTGSGGSTYNQIAQFNFFVVADTVPANFSSYWGGTGNLTPSVFVDIRFTAHEGSNTSTGHKQLIPNAVFLHKLNTDIRFPKSAGGDVSAATYSGSERKITLNGNYQSFGGSGVLKVDPDQLPLYQATPMIRGGGTISWVHTYNNTSSYATIAGVQVSPIFTSADSADNRKIWRVSMTYVG
jgi:hypothetical protein